jgi:hypothetical protein
VNPQRLACGGAIHTGRRHRPLWRTLVEPVLTALAVILVGALIGFGLFVVGR